MASVNPFPSREKQISLTNCSACCLTPGLFDLRFFRTLIVFPFLRLFAVIFHFARRPDSPGQAAVRDRVLVLAAYFLEILAA